MKKEIEEKKVWHVNGFLGIFVFLGAVGGVLHMLGAPAEFVLSCVGFLLFFVVATFVTILQPNEACVFTFFGKYIGTLKDEGFFLTPPFVSKTKVSLKTMTLQNGIQKINDELGNPLEVGIVVIWKIKDTVKATLGVENYQNYLSTQSDSCLRRIISMYPYDSGSDANAKSLRASNEEISETLQKEIQSKVELAGIEIIEAKINHLAYAPEIALAMLQRQQAAAIIDAKKLIVEGAVGMVDMALKEITKNNIVSLDDDKKAQMISNLLVVLCSNKDTQPVVNSTTN